MIIGPARARKPASGPRARIEARGGTVLGSKRRRRRTKPTHRPIRRRTRTRIFVGIGSIAIVVAALTVGSFTIGDWLSVFVAERERGPFNVIVVTADTLRADKLGCYGNHTIETPNLDRLAASGVLFENATSVTPLTLPAHSSIFTGTYPMHHGVRDNGGYYLGPEETTLAETLAERGYATGAFVAAFVLDGRWGLDQGFDRYFDDFDLSKYETVSLDSVQRRGDEVLTEALAWMGESREVPFFSWIHLYDAHTPYDPPEPYRTRYQGQRFGLYDGEVAYVDSLMGDLSAWLETNALSGNTILAFIGDHGESLGEHREMTHGFFVYDATMQVPFILKTPLRSLEGIRISSQVRGIDLMPTLLDLLDVPTPPTVQGESLLPMARGDEAKALSAYSESFYPRHHYGWSELKAVRTERFHFIAAPRPELYDVQNDPEENRNLAPQMAGTVRRFLNELDEILARHSADDIEDKGPASLDPDTQARLAALGYVGGPSKVKIDPSKVLADPKDKIELFNLIKATGADSSEGRLAEAFAKIRRVLEEDPDILEAHNILGNLHKKNGEPEKAIFAYREALARDPEYKSALFNLAVTYKELGRPDDAATGFRRVLELDPRDNKAYFLLAEIHASKKDYTGALALLRKASDVGSDRAPLHKLMAECHIELGQLTDAEEEIAQALRLNPELPGAHFDLALVHEERGEIVRAIEAYQEELRIAPKNFRAHFNLAKLYGALGDPGRQIEHFRNTVKLNPKFATGHLYLAKAYLDSGDLEQAMEQARTGVELGPEGSMAPLGHYILVDVYNRLGRFEDAEKELERARSLESS